MKAMKIGDASAQTTLAVPTLRKLVREGKIPHIKLGARVVFDADALAAWMKAKAVQPSSASPHQRNDSAGDHCL
jgi:excisionase family DNA binding protein